MCLPLRRQPCRRSRYWEAWWEIVTFREYSYNDGHNIADVEVPELSGSQAADEINDQVQAYTDQLIAQFQAVARQPERAIRGWILPAPW